MILVKVGPRHLDILLVKVLIRFTNPSAPRFIAKTGGWLRPSGLCRGLCIQSMGEGGRRWLNAWLSLASFGRTPSQRLFTAGPRWLPEASDMAGVVEDVSEERGRLKVSVCLKGMSCAHKRRWYMNTCSLSEASFRGNVHSSNFLS